MSYCPFWESIARTTKAIKCLTSVLNIGDLLAHYPNLYPIFLFLYLPLSFHLNVVHGTQVSETYSSNRKALFIPSFIFWLYKEIISEAKHILVEACITFSPLDQDILQMCSPI